MDCNITYTEASTRAYRARRRSGFSILETFVATAVASVVMVAIGSLASFAARSLAALSNYADLEMKSRNALDLMTRDIRQADRLTGFTTNELVFDYTNGTTLTFTYDSQARTLTRQLGGSPAQTLLSECDTLVFSIFQRNPVGGTYDQYPTATPETCKLVQLHWVCSREILEQRVNTESVQSAKIVIRRQ